MAHHHPDRGWTRRGLLTTATGTATGAALAALTAGCGSGSSSNAGRPTLPAPGGTGPAEITVAGLALVPIPADASFTFTTGLTNEGTGESAPLSTPYWLGRYPVTNVQYREFLQATGGGSVPEYWSSAGFPAGKADHPVLQVSAEAAKAYCDWVSSRASGWAVRLPTEAEWEHAARGPRRLRYPWADDPGTTFASGALTSRFNYNGVVAAYYLVKRGSVSARYTDRTSPRYGQREAISKILTVSATGDVSGWADEATRTGSTRTDVFATIVESGGFTTPVYRYPDGHSGYGCFDMAGNAFEWTSSLIVATTGAEVGKRVNAVRGGAWTSTGPDCRTSHRGQGRAGASAYGTVGFRVAATRT